MEMTATILRRGLYGMFAGGSLLGGLALRSASRCRPPMRLPTQCTVSGISNTSEHGVRIDESVSGLESGRPIKSRRISPSSRRIQAEEAYRAYFANNPQVEKRVEGVPSAGPST